MMPSPSDKTLKKVGALLLTAVILVAYQAYVRVIEKRVATELSGRRAIRELSSGLLLGTLLLWRSGSVVGSPWRSPRRSSASILCRGFRRINQWPARGEACRSRVADRWRLRRGGFGGCGSGVPGCRASLVARRPAQGSRDKQVDLICQLYKYNQQHIV
jgi:hypothetical protein